MARNPAAPVTGRMNGVDPAFAAANADGYSVPMNSMMLVRNGDAAPITVTVPTPGTRAGLAIDEQTIPVPAGAERLIGPFTDEVFDQGGNKVHVNFSAVANVTVAFLGR